MPRHLHQPLPSPLFTYILIVFDGSPVPFHGAHLDHIAGGTGRGRSHPPLPPESRPAHRHYHSRHCLGLLQHRFKALLVHHHVSAAKEALLPGPQLSCRGREQNAPVDVLAFAHPYQVVEVIDHFVPMIKCQVAAIHQSAVAGHQPRRSWPGKQQRHSHKVSLLRLHGFKCHHGAPPLQLPIQGV